jgi:hypothetical protein
MQVGDVIKTRKIRSYFGGKEARGWAEFVVDRERSRINQKAFVFLLMGIERLYGREDQQLDCNAVLRSMGWMPAFVYELPKSPKGRRETFALVAEHFDFCAQALGEAVIPRTTEDKDARSMANELRKWSKKLKRKAQDVG